MSGPQRVSPSVTSPIVDPCGSGKPPATVESKERGVTNLGVLIGIVATAAVVTAAIFFAPGVLALFLSFAGIMYGGVLGVVLAGIVTGAAVGVIGGLIGYGIAKLIQGFARTKEEPTGSLLPRSASTNSNPQGSGQPETEGKAAEIPKPAIKQSPVDADQSEIPQGEESQPETRQEEEPPHEIHLEEAGQSGIPQGEESQPPAKPDPLAHALEKKLHELATIRNQIAATQNDTLDEMMLVLTAKVRQGDIDRVTSEIRTLKILQKLADAAAGMGVSVGELAEKMRTLGELLELQALYRANQEQQREYDEVISASKTLGVEIDGAAPLLGQFGQLRRLFKLGSGVPSDADETRAYGAIRKIRQGISDLVPQANALEDELSSLEDPKCSALKDRIAELNQVLGQPGLDGWPRFRIANFRRLALEPAVPASVKPMLGLLNEIHGSISKFSDGKIDLSSSGLFYRLYATEDPETFMRDLESLNGQIQKIPKEFWTDDQISGRTKQIAEQEARIAKLSDELGGDGEIAEMEKLLATAGSPNTQIGCNQVAGYLDEIEKLQAGSTVVAPVEFEPKTPLAKRLEEAGKSGDLANTQIAGKKDENLKGNEIAACKETAYCCALSADEHGGIIAPEDMKNNRKLMVSLDACRHDMVTRELQLKRLGTAIKKINENNLDPQEILEEIAHAILDDDDW